MSVSNSILNEKKFRIINLSIDTIKKQSDDVKKEIDQLMIGFHKFHSKYELPDPFIV